MRLMRCAAALAAGIVFGFGLSLSGMLDPVRVRGFLDIAGLWSGTWDPRLAFVLAGAIAVAMLGTVVRRRLKHPALDRAFHLPGTTRIDARLLTGSAIFGVGWGMAGFCPGPAIASLALGLLPTALFVATMAIGMLAYDRLVAGAVPSISPGSEVARQLAASITIGRR